jgi:hypothetical protein
MHSAAAGGGDAGALRVRLEGLLEIFTIMDMVYNQVFATDKTLRETMTMFRSGSPTLPK